LQDFAFAPPSKNYFVIDENWNEETSFVASWKLANFVSRMMQKS